jgi:hypothetical protein
MYVVFGIPCKNSINSSLLYFVVQAEYMGTPSEILKVGANTFDLGTFDKGIFSLNCIVAGVKQKECGQLSTNP